MIHFSVIKNMNGQFDELPPLFVHDIINNRCKLLFHRSDKDAPSIFRTKDQMINDEMNAVSIMLVFHLMSEMKKKEREA